MTKMQDTVLQVKRYKPYSGNTEYKFYDSNTPVVMVLHHSTNKMKCQV